MFAKKLLAGAAGVLLAGFAFAADEPLETAPPPRPVPAVKTFAFEMRDKPWDDVLDWYSDASGLIPIYSITPKGKFNFTPPKDKKFAIGEITDILNDELAKQNLLVIRRKVSFTIVRTDEKIDYSLVPRIDLSELPQRGKTEIVQVLLPLQALAAEDVAPEVQKMLTPVGRASIMFWNTLLVLDTAGNVNRIWQVLRPHPECCSNVFSRRLKYAKAEESAKKLEMLLVAVIPGRVEDVAVTADPKTNTVATTAPAVKLELARRLLEEWDRHSVGDTFPKPGDPELRKYSVPPGTAEDLAKILPALAPSLRVLALPKSGELLALGTPSQQRVLTVLFKLLGPNPREKWTVIRLQRTGPEEMAEKLKKLFPSPDLKLEVVKDETALRVYASEATTRQIVEAIQAIEGVEAAPRKSAPPFKPESELQKYTVPAGSADDLAKTLRAYYPSLRVFPLPDSNAILVLATLEEHGELALLLRG
jgi:hypothetical protein